MTKEEEQENILTKEIESWSKFEYVLKEEEEYSKAFKAKGEYNSAESFFMTLIFQQQKMSSTLIEKHSK